MSLLVTVLKLLTDEVDEMQNLYKVTGKHQEIK